MLVGGRDMLLIPPTGSGKSLIFQSAPILFDIVKAGMCAEMCEVDRPCNFSSGFAYVGPSSLSKIYLDGKQAKKRVERGQCQI